MSWDEEQAQKYADEHLRRYCSGLTVKPEVRELIRTEIAAAWVARSGAAFEGRSALLI